MGFVRKYGSCNWLYLIERGPSCIRDHPWYFGSMNTLWCFIQGSSESSDSWANQLLSSMNEASGVCVSMNPVRWDFKIHEVAQSGFRYAHHLLTCISDQAQATNTQEVNFIAQEALTEFRKLLTLLDEERDYKRIKKGPLLNSGLINPVEWMDCPSPLSQSHGCNSIQPNIIKQLIPLQNTQSSTALFPTNTFNLYREKQNLAFQRCYSGTNLAVPNNSITGLNFPQKSAMSLITMDGSSIDGQTIRYSSSEILASRNDSSKRKCGAKSEEESMRCVASTGGCHCTKKRWLLFNSSSIWL